MIFRCIFSHEFGLPRLDETGVVRKQCMKCGRAVASAAKLAPESAQVALLQAQRAQAIELLGDRWVGLPSNEEAESLFTGANPPLRSTRERPALHVISDPGVTLQQKTDEENRAA
jgi:hypothetical protein